SKSVVKQPILQANLIGCQPFRIKNSRGARNQAGSTSLKPGRNAAIKHGTWTEIQLSSRSPSPVFPRPLNVVNLRYNDTGQCIKAVFNFLIAGKTKPTSETQAVGKGVCRLTECRVGCGNYMLINRCTK